MPPCPTTTAARSTVTGTPGDGKQLLDLPARTQVRRQVAVVDAEAAEIDDPVQARVGSGAAEVHRGVGVPFLEVVRVERMDEVVRGVDALERCGDAVGIGDVAVDRRPGAVVVVRVTGHRAYVVAGLDQCLRPGATR